MKQSVISPPTRSITASMGAPPVAASTRSAKPSRSPRSITASAPSAFNAAAFSGWLTA